MDFSLIPEGFDQHVAGSVLLNLLPLDQDTERPSVEKVRQQLRASVATLFEQWDRLRDILARHEATINRRWLKKDRSKRLQILRAAYPNMPASHVPDFHAYRTENSAVAAREPAESRKDAYMIPYINLQDLCEGRSPPLLLNSRTQHPSFFAAADRDAMRLGISSRGLKPAYLKDHVVLLISVPNHDDYGRLTGSEEDIFVRLMASLRLDLMPGEALLVLQAQNRVLEVLNKCCEQILHDVGIDHLSSQQYPLRPDFEFEQPSSSLLLESLSTLAHYAQYQIPGHLSLSTIEVLLGAATAASEDNLWAIREDPVYFEEMLIENKGYYETIRGHTHKPAARSPKFSKYSTWYLSLTEVVYEGYLKLEWLSELWSQAQQLLVLQNMYEDQIDRNNPLPGPYLNAIVEFRYTITRLSLTYLKNLQF